jgi:hypothetical protein
MDLVMGFLEQHSKIEKVYQLYAIILQYPDCTQFNKPYRQVMQWSAKGINIARGMIVPVLMATLSNPSVSQKNPITAALSSVKK